MPIIGASPSGARLTVTTTQSPTKSRRRNLRMDDDPRRCEQIAKLLVAGHKGSSLEAMVKKFDAETNLRQKQEPRTPTLPESAVKRSSAATIVRRSSSCPPLDIAAAELFRLDGPKSTSGPIRRSKPLRAAATMPYPLTFKSSRSVSPPMSPPYLDSASTPIEGPFANSTFTFDSAIPNFFPQPESIAPKDTIPLTPLSQITSPVDLNYNWDMSAIATHSLYSLPSSHSMPGHGASGPLLPLRMLDGQTSDGGWNSEFEWLPTEDDAGTSTAPPSTPDEAPSPAMTQILPLEEVAARTPFSADGSNTSELMDLSEYAKGLQLFSHNSHFDASRYTIPAINANDLTPLSSHFDNASEPSLWQLSNIINMNMSTDGTEDYHY